MPKPDESGPGCLDVDPGCDASEPIDGWRPRWSNFLEVLLDDSATAPSAPFMLEINRDTGSRREWTRIEWREFVIGVAARLRSLDVQTGEAVAVLAGNTADALAVAFACWVNGSVYLPLNAHEPMDRQVFILHDANCRLLLHDLANTDDAEALGAAVGVSVVATTTLDGVRADTDLNPALDDTQRALRVYTSGTTGDPKGVVLTTRNLLTDVEALLDATGWNAETRVIVVLPIHHVNGLVVSSLQAWCAGASLVLCDRFRSEFFWADVREEQATVSSLVPSLLEFLLQREEEGPPTHFVEVFSGAGPLMTETVLEFERRFDRPVRHLYGLSECTAVATMMPRMADSERLEWYSGQGFPSIGCAVAHVSVAVLSEEGTPCGPGTRGEIAIRGATVMVEYANRPVDTAETKRHGWLHSGDEGFWLPGSDGTPFFFLTGRIKELIIRGGMNISPFLVDEVLNAHPKVRFGLAIPFENRYYGEEVAAYVVPEGPVDEEEILSFCASRLDFALRPKVVIFGQDVPYTTTGKAKRLKLRNQLAESLSAYRDVQFRRRSMDASLVSRKVSKD